MKPIFLTTLLLLTYSFLYSQNHDAPYNLSHYNGQPAPWGYTVNINYNDSTVFAHSWDKFMLGWQWTTEIPSVINKRLYTNVQPAAFLRGCKNHLPLALLTNQ